VTQSNIAAPGKVEIW